jgi:hypothetical protein
LIVVRIEQTLVLDMMKAMHVVVGIAVSVNYLQA